MASPELPPQPAAAAFSASATEVSLGTVKPAGPSVLPLPEPPQGLEVSSPSGELVDGAENLAPARFDVKADLLTLGTLVVLAIPAAAQTMVSIFGKRGSNADGGGRHDDGGPRGSRRPPRGPKRDRNAGQEYKESYMGKLRAEKAAQDRPKRPQAPPEN